MDEPNRRTTFFVVLAFLWKTGLVCPPYPNHRTPSVLHETTTKREGRTRLLSVVSSLSLSESRCFTGLVLGDLVGRVLLAGLSFAVANEYKYVARRASSELLTSKFDGSWER